MFLASPKLTSLDLYRDGGSMSASYEFKSGVCFVLMFQAEFYPNIDINLGRNLEIKGYLPVLEKHTKSDYVSPVTGVSSLKWIKETTDIDWKEARKILNKLRKSFPKLKSDYSHVFQEMLKIAEINGKIRENP